MSIFSEYYTDQKFEDKYLTEPENAVDVIIPVYHTNELWRINLISIFREVPVRNLLISDGGVIDGSLEVLSEFPRVKILNHRNYKTLGICIAQLIKEVTSEWFIYLHSDVYLPKNWFSKMISHKGEYDWYGCPMHITVLVNYKLHEPGRPYAGSQLGRKEAFLKFIDRVEDDFVYRQEDFVFNKIVEDAGFKTGKVEDTFHYHQLMYRKSAGYDLNVNKVYVETNTKEEEKTRAALMQIKGIVKYLDPIEVYVIDDFKSHFDYLLNVGLIEFDGFKDWVAKTNPLWLKYVDRLVWVKIKIARLKSFVKRFLKNGI